MDHAVIIVVIDEGSPPVRVRRRGGEVTAGEVTATERAIGGHEEPRSEAAMVRIAPVSHGLLRVVALAMMAGSRHELSG